MNISDEALKKLKCTRCHLYLSVGPVTNSHGNNFLCGRCSSGGVQIKIYEALAENFTFPCRYQSFGCREMIKWGSVTTHELNCIKKPHFCAAVPPGICLWRGASSDMAEHFIENHEEDVLDKNMLEIKLHENMEQCKLVKIKKACYIFHVYFNKEQQLLKLNFMQLSVRTEAYQLTLYSPNFSKRITLGADFVQLYSSMDHNKIKDDNVIDMGVLKFLTGNELSLLCEIIILGEQEKSNEDLLKLLECPICNEYMDSPIYQCKTGHSFCNSCVPKLKDCPFCHMELTETRNYVLETLVSQVSHNCKNKNLGCTYSGPVDQVERHENTCWFFKCPLETSQNCTWTGSYENLVHHVKDSHVFLATESYGLVCSLTVDTEGVFRLIYYEGAFFKISRRYVDEVFSVSVQFVGPSDKAVNYLYEFSFLGIDNSETNLCIKDVCQSMTADEHAFDNCLKIPYSLLKSFVKNDKLKCNIRLNKKRDVLTL